MESKNEMMSRVTANLMIILGDVLDSAVTLASDYAARTNKAIRHDSKRFIKAAAHNAKMAGMAIREASEDSQIKIGDDSDVLLALILLAIDRTGGDIDSMTLLYETFKKKVPSALNLPLESIEKIAFGELKDDCNSGTATIKA